MVHRDDGCHLNGPFTVHAEPKRVAAFPWSSRVRSSCWADTPTAPCRPEYRADRRVRTSSQVALAPCAATSKATRKATGKGSCTYSRAETPHDDAHAQVQDALPMVVAVRGRVGTAEPLVAEQTPDEGVMLEQVRCVAIQLLDGHSVQRHRTMRDSPTARVTMVWHLY
jgi:hypothetical protein